MVAIYSALKKFFYYLNVSGKINHDPTVNIERPKPKAANLVERTYLKPEEIQRCFAFVKKKGGIWEKRNRAMLIMYFATGIRNTCLTEINVDNVDFENGCVYVIDKGTKPNTIYLDEDKMNALKEWIDDRKRKLTGHTNTNALFINKRYKRIEPEGASWVIKEITKNVGHKISPHKARASFLTNAYNSGVPLDVVSKLANHSSTKVTLDCYIQDQDQRVKEAGIQATKYLKI
jgi:integrase/recombinase XerD